jgi:hypothetical protein
VEALERREQRTGGVHVEARPVVVHEEGANAVAIAEPDLDARGGAAAGELPGVVEQVAHQDACEPGVAVGVEPTLDDEPDRAARLCAFEPGPDLSRQGAEVDFIRPGLAARDSRQEQEGVDERAHAQ